MVRNVGKAENTPGEFGDSGDENNRTMTVATTTLKDDKAAFYGIKKGLRLRAMVRKRNLYPQGVEQTPPTPRQAKFLPVLLTSPTYTQACRKGKVSRDILSGWLTDSAFKVGLQRLRAQR
jgi:hypothetical protein